jgi:hypothetical protein
MSEPASNLTLIGNDFRFQIGDTASPPNFSDFCAVVDAGAIGETKPLIDVTTLCDQARTYRGGLRDGKQIVLKCNFLQGDTVERALVAAFKASTLEVFRLEITGTSPLEYFQFHAAVIDWAVTAVTGTKSEISITVKVSGGVDWIHS